MKVLVIQLARLGDIYQTWPTFFALKRAGAEVHVLVRPRFRGATSGCAAIAKTHEFRTDEILGPVLTDGRGGLVQSMTALDTLQSKLADEKFDRIINLSFSPLSSWLAFDLEMRGFAEGRTVSTVGYTRHADGALAIPDDASAYFFAQVGSRATAFTGEAVNRISLARLFATIAQGAVPQLELTEQDWQAPFGLRAPYDELLPSVATEGFFAVHIGASDADKTLDAKRWAEIAGRVVQSTGCPVLLLGSPEEVAKSREIVNLLQNEFGVPKAMIVDGVGRTKIEEVFPLLERAKLLVAGDSALVHMASLTATKVLNLSSRTVSHWETGPASAGSRILIYGGAGPETETVVSEARSMLRESDETAADRLVLGPMEDIATKTGDAYADFLWSFTSGLYMGTEFAVPQDGKLMEAVQQWMETSEIAEMQLKSMQELFKRSSVDEEIKLAASIIERTDEVAALIVEAEPRLAPLFRWLTTEKSRLGPQAKEEIVEHYLRINKQLTTVLETMHSQGAIDDRYELGL